MSDNESSIVKTEELDKALKTIIPYSFEMEKIEKSNCKLCKCEFRAEAEAYYEAQPKKNYTAIMNMLKDKKNFDISVTAIRNHMLYHYLVVERNQTISEYAGDLQKWVNSQTDKVSSLRTRIGVLEREMMHHVTDGEDLSGEDRRKNTEIIRKLTETILLHQDKLDKIQDDIKPITVVFQQLQIIIQDEMKDINNVTVKKVLVKVLDRLRENIGDMVIG